MSALNANSARFLLTIADRSPADFTVTRFTGADAVSSPYRFDIDFQLSESAQKQAKPPVLTAAAILGKPCRFELIRGSDNSVAAYNGVVMGFNAARRANPVYSVRLVPWMQLLSLNTNNRVFQKQSVIDIVKKVFRGVGLEGYCDFKYQCELKYQPVDFCVQYQETDLNFVSRLMERNGIWFYFDGGAPGKETVVITDSFSKFPAKAIKIPFVENIGFAEGNSDEDGAGGDGGGGASANGDSSNGFGESVYSLSTKSAMIPRSVKIRTQNYRTPESLPEGKCEGAEDGQWGSVYEYGGAFKNADEAMRGAALYMRRMQIENMRTEGMSGCTAFRAGRLASITPGVGDFLIVSVNHAGGINEKDGVFAYTYNNNFCCIDSAPALYAPPLTAAPPKAAGLITAPVEALGEEHPNLDELGRYRVKLPFDVSETDAYGATKDIRLSQPSGGSANGEQYGFHFPSKAGAEMVLACIEANPDKPIGLGFVPNANAPSGVNNENRDQNIMRTWGGNELLMDDTAGRERAVLSTAGQDTEKNCELSLDNEEKNAVLRAWKHKLSLSCSIYDSSLALSSQGLNEIKIDDITRKITMETLMGCALELNEQKDTITLANANTLAPGAIATGMLMDKLMEKSSIEIRSTTVKEAVKGMPWKTKKSKELEKCFPRNCFTMDGKNKNIVLETAGGCKIAIYDKMIKSAEESGKGKIIITTKDGCVAVLDNENNVITLQDAGKANKAVLDGKNKKLSLESTGDISIKAGKSISITAEEGINIKAEESVNINGKNVTVASKEMAILKSEKKAAVKGKSGLNLTASDAGGGVMTQSKKGEASVKGNKITLN
ncbi:MAG: type VI secretion system Vgr family protein [Chitinispirillia bacterium]|nr:type VI secretion system Vgr family protein [Chitinispirillia bacterium]